MQKINVIHNIEQMIKADYPLISLISSEYNRTLQYIRHIASQNNADFYQWDCVNGLAKHSRIENSKKWKIQTIPDQEDYLSLLKYLFHQTETGTNNKKAIYFIEDFQRYLNDIQVITYLRKIAENWKSQNKHFVMCGTAASLPKELEKFITLVDFPLPDYKDLSKLFAKVAAGSQEIDEELEKYMIDAALGMTDMEAELAFRLAKQKNELKDKESVRIISSEKEQIIKKSGILDYYPVAEGLKEVGGLENLKSWLKQRHKAFEPKAKFFGLKEPKGIMLVGVPGCGKSLAAKATAAEWKLPLLRLDVGKIYQAEVGASESNLREAIKTAEAVAPCVLWIDEIEKGLGNGSERDGGTSSRVFATILSWMQEKEKPVFVFATANNLQQLPPELLRKGRFDEIFFVDLPTPKERENIFQIHLQKKKQTKIDNLAHLAEKTKHFNGSEIEEVVNEAMFIAYNEDSNVENISIKHLEKAIEQIVPLAFTMGNEIRNLREFGRNRRARPAGKEENKEDILLKNEQNEIPSEKNMPDSLENIYID